MTNDQGLQSACTRLLQPGLMTMSPSSFSPQHPQEGSSDVRAKNEDTVAGIVLAGLAGGPYKLHYHLLCFFS